VKEGKFFKEEELKDAWRSCAFEVDEFDGKDFSADYLGGGGKSSLISLYLPSLETAVTLPPADCIALRT